VYDREIQVQVPADNHNKLLNKGLDTASYERLSKFNSPWV